MTQILLIDLSGLCHMLWHVSGSDPDPDATSRKVVERVRALASGQPHVAICLDSGRSFRREIDAAYKAQRPEPIAALQHQMATAIDVLRGDGFPCWAAKGMEADDVIASAVHEAAVRSALLCDDVPSVVVVSSDKDLRALVGPRVTVRTFDGVVYDEAKVLEKHGVRPDQLVDWLSLVGDSSDNIKGCNGVGDVKAAQLLAKFGTLDGIYQALETQGTLFTPALATNLREFQPRMATVRALVTMRTDVPVPFEEVFRARVPADVAVFTGEDDDTMDETAPSATSETSAEPAGPEPPGAATQRPAADVAAGAPLAPPAGTSQGLMPVPAPAVPVVFQGWEGFEPGNMHQAAWLADQMHRSRLFSAYGSMQAVLSTFLAGKELGLSMMASLRAFHIIEGKPCLSADLIRSLVLRSDRVEYFRCTARSADAATFVIKRKGDDEVSLTYTVQEGRQAFSGDDKAWAKSGWGRNPADMCVARAGSKLARLVCPDVVHGFYAPEEMDIQP